MAVVCLCLPSAARALSNLPYYDNFTYPDGANLSGTNGWKRYTTGSPYGILGDEYHGWAGYPGGTATATNGDGRVAGVSLLKVFGDYTKQPGLGLPTSSGKYDKATVVTVRYEYEPDPTYVSAAAPTTWSKFGTMFSETRWHYENRGSYYTMMTVVRYFIETNGLITAYNGHRIKPLTHAPITNRSVITVTADYTNKVWSLWVGDEPVVTNFALFKTQYSTDMSHDGWFKDYDGLKEMGFIDASSNRCTLLDQVRVFEGAPSSRKLPFIETFETRVVGGQPITITNGSLHAQNGWFATKATVSSAAQSTAPASLGSNGVSIAGGGECFQLFLDKQTNVWTDLWLKPLTSGSGNTTVDAGGEDAVFWIDAVGAVHAYDGLTSSVVTSVVPNAWSRFTVQTDYGTATWNLLVGGVPVAVGLDFQRTAPGNRYEEVRVSTSGSAVSALDDLTVSVNSPFNVPTVSFESAAVPVSETVTTVNVTVRLSHASLHVIAVEYVLNPGGTAALADDYAASDGTVIFAPGETNLTFAFTVVNDADNEEDETFSFSITNIANAVTGAYQTVTYTIASDPADWGNLPFYEPFEYRTLGSLNGQRGWTATDVDVQTNATYGGSSKAALGVRLGSALAHTFTNGALRVVSAWRAKAVFAQHPPPPPASGSYAFYVATNGHIVTFDEGVAVDQGTNVILAADTWADFRVATDHGSKTWDLRVNGIPVAAGLGFQATNAASYRALRVTGPATLDDITIGYDAPAAPTGLTAVPRDARVDLTWGVSQGAVLYHVKRATTGGGPYTQIGVTNVLGWSDLTAVNDTLYYYVVSASNPQGEGPLASEVSAIPRAAVTGVVALAGISFVDLTWNAFAGATNYLVKRSTTAGGPYTTVVPTNATSYHDTNVVNGITYRYVIVALTAAYASTASDEVSATPNFRTILYDSFEYPVVTGRTPEGGTMPPGWARYNTGHVVDPRAGLWNEDSLSMVTPFGEQAAWVWFDRYFQTTGIQERFQAGATYRLTFNVAAEFALGDIAYQVELLHGTNVLAFVTQAWTLDTMDFALRSDSIVYQVPTNHPAVGDLPVIRLRYLSGDWHYVIGYDNVRLTCDRDPPPILPDPMTFAVPPASHSATSIVMVATLASNAVPPFAYRFENTSNGVNSGWIASTAWTNFGLTPQVTYGYRVKARDSYSNETAWSAVQTAYPIDLVAPLPNPAQFLAGSPAAAAPGTIAMTAVAGADVSGPVAYRFENVTRGYNSGWSTNAAWVDTGLTGGLTYGYRVQMRDAAPTTNTTAWSAVTTAIMAGVPTVTTDGGASTYLADRALLRGELTAGYVAFATICWGPVNPGVDSIGAWAQSASVGSVTQGMVFSTLATGLAPTNTYYYRCYASNALADAWSTVATFTTPDVRNVMTNIVGGNDSWNVGGNWTYGHAPVGGEAATVGLGVAAKVDNNMTPAYSGGLILAPGASLQVGWTTAHASNINVLGTGPMALHDGASLIARLGMGNYTFTQPLTLAAAATIWPGISTANHNTTKTLGGGVSGPGKLNWNGVNGTWGVFNTANPAWSGGLATADPQSQSHQLRADTNSCFGSGAVAINSRCSLQIQAGVTNAIANAATLSVAGLKSGSLAGKLVLNGSDTVNQFWVDGVQKPAGVYSSASGLTDSGGGALIAGSGTLTVLDSPVTIANSGAVNVVDTQADLVGILDARSDIIEVRLFWSTNNHADAGFWLADATASNRVLGPFTNAASLSITGAVSTLQPTTTYYYTMLASNLTTNVWATPNATFTTLAPPTAPGVDTGGGATNLGAGTATLRGRLTSGSFASGAFCWGAADGGTASTGAWVNVVAAGLVYESAVFSNAVAGALYGVPYGYRVYVTNGAGTAWSALAAFATLPPPGVGIVTTGAASIGAATATLAGTLQATGSVFAVTAYWSTNNNAGAAAWLADVSAAQAAIGPWTNVVNQPVAASVGGLAGGTTYYYTMRASNAATNIWASSNASFTTLAAPVVNNAGGATNVVGFTATLQGLLTAGGAATATIVWGTNTPALPEVTTNWPYVAPIGTVNQGVGFATNVGGLILDKTYYYRCYVTNAFGESWSAVTNFTTPRLTVTFIGTNTASADRWNLTWSWDKGVVPSGAMDVVVPTGKLATAWSASTPSFTGNLTLGSNATLQIGWTTVYTQSYAALGTPGITTITMHNGAYIHPRMGSSPVMPAVQLQGAARMGLRSSTYAACNPQFNYGIHGPYPFTFEGKAGATVYLNTSNGVNGIVAKGTDNIGPYSIQANAPGSLGSGDVTVEAYAGDNKVCALLTINAVDAMADTAVLRITGSNSTTRLAMNANDTIAGLVIDGITQPAGTYGRVGLGGVTYAVGWMTGNGVLTIPVPPFGHWDRNGSTAGAGGASPSGLWDAATPNWNGLASGAGSVFVWPAGQTAIFAAGADATGTYTVTVSGTQDIGGVTVEEGAVTLTGGTLCLTSNANFSVAAGLTATVDTVITNDATARQLTKSGAGTLVLAGVNFFAGETRVVGGRLTLAGGATLSDSAPLSIAAGTTVEARSGVNETVHALNLGGAPMWPGTWGSTASTAQFQDDVYFAGPGVVTVLTGISVTFEGTLFRFR